MTGDRLSAVALPGDDSANDARGAADPSHSGTNHGSVYGGLADLRALPTDYEKSLPAFFCRASIASMYGIAP
jgi:hypothetical protein